MLSAEEQMHIIKSGAAQIVPEAALLEKLKRQKPLTIKLGVDPTSPDLHLGHAVPLRKMRQFQDLGHNVVLIIGNGTALIGDPSGKNTTRPQLSQEDVQKNAETYVAQAMKVLDPEKTKIVYNGDWILNMGLKELLELCSNFTVARILERDDFTKRYKAQTPIALHEFLYPVMQANDSVEVKADVEMGGTDQLFNLLAGRELMEKMGTEPQVALTMPLLEGTDGVRKMSKSYGNSIALSNTEEETAKLIKKAKTDSDRNITFDPENRPGVSALLTTAALCTGRDAAEIAAEIGDAGCGALKSYVTEAVNTFLAPIREKRHELEGKDDMIHEILMEGNKKANEIAEEKLQQVREAMGMVY